MVCFVHNKPHARRDIKRFADDDFYKPGFPKDFCDHTISVADFLYHSSAYGALSRYGTDLLCVVAFHIASEEIKFGWSFEDFAFCVGILGTNFDEEFDEAIEQARRARKAFLAASM